MCLKWPLQKASVLTVESSDNSDSSDDLISTDDPPVEVISLLSRLKCPAKSDLSQKRKIQHNLPKGKKRSSTHHKKEPKASEHLKEFPNEDLAVSGSHLFCNACREILSVKRSTISNHLKSSKYQTSRENLYKKHFLGLLEENVLHLTDCSYMRELVPYISTEERSTVNSEIHGKFISLIFDGTSRLREALALVV